MATKKLKQTKQKPASKKRAKKQPTELSKMLTSSRIVLNLSKNK